MQKPRQVFADLGFRNTPDWKDEGTGHEIAADKGEVSENRRVVDDFHRNLFGTVDIGCKNNHGLRHWEFGIWSRASNAGWRDRWHEVFVYPSKRFMQCKY